ncbi:hypothetical protein EYC80_004744 [Monilinia laxa]|uniref:Uncharacterized protein n=1 Tax=Monilinia laxa TaxID=61186 RepID=A0A5N6KHP7_MONLA|nr:hypothetical protein EYC80_004744 [Monilinia laxa]
MTFPFPPKSLLYIDTTKFYSSVYTLRLLRFYGFTAIRDFRAFDFIYGLMVLWFYGWFTNCVSFYFVSFSIASQSSSLSIIVSDGFNQTWGSFFLISYLLLSFFLARHKTTSQLAAGQQRGCIFLFV